MKYPDFKALVSNIRRITWGKKPFHTNSTIHSCAHMRTQISAKHSAIPTIQIIWQITFVKKNISSPLLHHNIFNRIEWICNQRSLKLSMSLKEQRSKYWHLFVMKQMWNKILKINRSTENKLLPFAINIKNKI